MTPKDQGGEGYPSTAWSRATLHLKFRNQVNRVVKSDLMLGSENSPCNPRNPQQQSVPGQRRIVRQEETRCLTSPQFVRCCSLWRSCRLWCWECPRLRPPE